MRQSLHTAPLLILLIASPTALAANLEVVAIDHGNPAIPQEGAPLPGQTTSVFFTLRNTSSEAQRNLILQGIPGTCVADLAPSLRIAELGPGTAVRIESPLALTLDANCQPGDTADLLLKGAYSRADGTRPAVWATHEFPITGPQAPFDQETFLNLPIPDAGPTVDIEFAVRSAGTVASLGVQFTATHKYWGEIEATLIHPDGTAVIIAAHLSDDGTFTRSYGALGTDRPYAALTPLLRKPMTGVWRIRFRDKAENDVGVVSQARLVLRP